jgi:hypothetical protein
MIAQKNVSHLFYTTAALATTALPTSAYQIGIRRIGESLCDASALVAGDQFQVIQWDADSKVRMSPVYTWSNLISKNITSLSALVPQVTHIGYNATDGDIVATNSGNYLVTIGFRDLLKQIGGKRLYKFGEYQAGTTAHNHDIAIALADSINANLAKDAFPRLIATAICSSAFVTGNGTKSNQETTVVQGSRYITFETDLAYASSTDTVLVGDYLRIGTAAHIQGTPALGSSVYRVVELTSATVVKVDRPVTEPSGTYEDLTTGTQLEVIPKATAEASTVKWGVKLYGNDANAPFVPGMYGPNLIMFTVGVSPDFSTTDVRLTTTPFIGEATMKQIRQLDWELRANNKEPYRVAEWIVPTASNVQISDTIDHLRTFIFKDNSTDVLGNVAESYMTLMIASDSTANGDLDTVFTQT